MEHKIRQQRWINYSLALLLAFTLSWGLTQPVQAAEEATQIGVNLSQGDPITGLTVTFRVQSNGGTEPITGSIIVQGSWGESCTKTLTAADNLPVPIGHTAGSTCQMSPPLGIHTITVTYGGDSFYAPSSRQNIEIISKYFADLVITAHTPNSSSIDQAVLVQYSVTAVRSLPFSPTGTVFVTDGVNSCISTPATGQCSLILETSGTRTLSASYSGDATFRGDSASVSHTVNGYATTTTITADSPDPSTQGQTVSVSYSVVANDPSKGAPSGNVTVSDGVASCTGTVAAGSCALTLNTAGARTLTATYAGNSKFAGSTAAGEPHTVNAPDTTPPVITASGTKADGSPYTTGTWTNQNVLVHFTCSDTGSGIATCPGDQLLSLDGTFTAEGTATDNAGNSATVSFGPIQIDKSAPTVTVSGTKADGTSYTPGTWTNQNLLVHFTCSDAGSGIATCPADQVISPDGTFTAEGTATDNAGNSAAVSFGPIQIDKSAPTVTVSGTKADGTPYTPGTWTNQNVLVDFTCSDARSGIATCPSDQVISPDGAFTAEGTARDNAGNSATVSFGPIQIDKSAPTVSAAAATASNGNGWYNSNLTIRFTCTDNLSGVTSCPADEILSGEGSTVSSTAQTITDLAGNSSTPSNIVTVQIDKTAPVVTVTGVSAGGSYPLGSVPTAGCSTTDALSGVATQATFNVTGGDPDGTGNFAATCSGAGDNAGNSAAPVSVTYSVTAVVNDSCTTSALLDNFNRANGGLGSNWAGLTGQTFYKITSNRVDVQLGGPVVWKPTSFGVNQAAFVTLSTLDAGSPSQGVLLKVQSGTIPNAGAIAVVYDNLAKTVRVSTLRLNTPTWTVYGNTPATFANGDKLVGCVQANGTVRVYQNNTLLTTVTLNAADQGFFNAKGGKIGLWTVAAPNAFFDDFGGGALTGVSSATLDATTVPDELADDGAEITVAENFPTDNTATAPDAGVLANRAFLPLVNR